MKREGAAAAGILALFVALRLPLLRYRQPFFDELFTWWISAKSFGEIVAALRYDSGPPLYYFLVHLFSAGRIISLVASLIAIVLLLRKKQFLAAAFVAVFPPSVLFAVDARSYALCALFVTIGVLYEKVDAIAFVLAAYSHFYGVLFFPLLIRKPKSLALAVVLFAPGFALAAMQPASAREWMTFAWPEALFVRPPIALAILGGLALLASLRLNKYLAMVLVPLVLAIVLRVYVPLRFESVIAAPLALCIAEGLKARRGILQEALASLLLGAAAIWSVIGIVDHANRAPDDYARAASWVACYVSHQERVVASGYLYLETIEHGRPDAFAFPVEQAIHPGWRAFATSKDVAPQPPFVWIGERGSRELAFVANHHRVEPLCFNAHATVARIR
ncbi:MAG TPA: hypothetical protein VF381_04550 [Thermoanaerobaculia bacterium]